MTPYGVLSSTNQANCIAIQLLWDWHDLEPSQIAGANLAMIAVLPCPRQGAGSKAHVGRLSNQPKLHKKFGSTDEARAEDVPIYKPLSGFCSLTAGGKGYGLLHKPHYSNPHPPSLCFLSFDRALSAEWECSAWLASSECLSTGHSRA